MANWEYKVLSSGKHGMATMAALEQYLNDLGQQQWEIVNWQTGQDNLLLFTGLARRPILRDWKPDEMPAAQAAAQSVAKVEKTEADKERDAWRETIKEELEFFSEKENDVEEAEADTEELLDVLRPMMKRSQRGPGAIGAIGFLARRLEQSDEDLLGALAEAGVALPADLHTVPTAMQHDDEFFWLNQNQRGEIWLNCGPKAPIAKPPPAPRPERHPPPPRPSAPAAATPPPVPAAAGEESPVAPSAPPERPPNARTEPLRERAPNGRTEPLPEGEAFLVKLRPMMRRNRRGRGWSGSTSYLSRALRRSEAELQEVLARIGLTLPADPQAKPIFVELSGYLYWLNIGQGGQIWINARERRDDEVPGSGPDEDDLPEAAAGQPAFVPAAGDVPAPLPAAPVPPQTTELPPPAAVQPLPSLVPPPPVPADVGPTTAPPPAPPPADPLSPEAIFTTIRPHFLKNKRSAALSAAPGALAEALRVAQADLVDALVRAGLAVPASEGDKPVFAEHAGEIFWFNRNAKDELWLNAKAKPARKPSARSSAAKPKKKAE